MAAAIWQAFFDRSGVVILDGGLATELERRGADIDDPLWSAKLLIENPELIRQVHEDYFRAGADVGISSTYQATFDGFANHGLDANRAAELMRLSVRLVQDARDRFWDDPNNRIGRCRPLVAASIGCYGAALADGSEYRGHYGLTGLQLIDWHRRRLDVLAPLRPDVFACETIPCLQEAVSLAITLAQYPDIPSWLSFSCCDDEHLSEGQRFVEGVKIAQAASTVVAVGVNCTVPHLIEGLLKSVQGETSLPLIVYPNSGERWNAAQRRWENGPTPFDWGEAAKRWHAAGARIIGGCCRTTPATIGAIAAALRGSAD